MYSSSPKARALARASDLAIQACARAVLALLIKVGRGSRLRSWYSAEEIARLLPRSADIPRYSRVHVRVALRQLVAAGLVRGTVVKPGEAFPDPEQPDVDGGGLETARGGKVYEVNVDALLGRGPVWLPPPPAPPSGLLEDLVDDESEGEGEAEAFPGLPARDEASGDASPAASANALPDAAQAPQPVSERVVMDDHGGVVMDPHPSDLSATLLNNDPAPPGRAGAPPAAPASDASETPSTAPAAPARAAPANEASESPAASEVSRAARRQPAPESESERRRGREEQAKCQREPGRAGQPVTAAQMQADLRWLLGPRDGPSGRGGGSN